VSQACHTVCNSVSTVLQSYLLVTTTTVLCARFCRSSSQAHSQLSCTRLHKN